MLIALALAWLVERAVLAIMVTASVARIRRRFELKSGGGENFIVALGPAFK